MNKLKPLTTLELRFFEGYIEAASEMFLRSQLYAALEARGFEIHDPTVAVHETIAAAYPDGFNTIEFVAQRTVEQMESEINAFLTVERAFWKTNFEPSQIEANLRAGYWDSLSACFDYKTSQVYAVGPNVPYISMGFGFTYVLNNKEMSRCLVLVGNTTD